MSGVNIPTDSSHLSDQAIADMIEQYGGIVDSQFAKKSIMKRFVNLRTVRGTDTITDRRVGRTTLTTITPGVRPAATPTPYGKTSVTVDTVVLARDNQSLLNDFQADFAVRKELGMDHGKEIGKDFDSSIIIAGIKGAAATPANSLNSAFGPGLTTTLAASGDETDPSLLYKAIAGGVTNMEAQDIDTDECVCLVDTWSYDVLLNNDKLVDRDFSTGNGDFADGTFKTLKGVPVVSTNRIPSAAITGHKLSNANNGNFYDVTAAEARTKALVLHPKAILAGSTIPMTSDIYFDKVEKQWFIDSWIAYGANFNRPDCAFAVRSFD